MKTFLEQPEATFYHVTTIEKWNEIKRNGLSSGSGCIFVSRVGELPVLLAIAMEQLPEIYNTNAIVFLKLPQARNNFLESEVIPDNQALVEWTKDYQNIILRKHIPIENLELMMEINLGEYQSREFLMTFLTRIASAGQQNYLTHIIAERSRTLRYN